MTEFRIIESQHEHFFAEPKPMKQVIAGMLNPGMFSLSPIVDVACYFDDEDTHVET